MSDGMELEVQQPNAVTDQSKEMTHSQLMTRVTLKPEYNAAVTALQFSADSREGGAGLFDMCAYLAEESERVQNGDLGRMESMLVSQAHTLDVMFATLAKKAATQMDAGYPKAADIYLRLAMKSQAQCRTTIEALTEIKYPKAPTFVKQQNVGQNVQVNNGVPNNATSTPAHARTEEKDVTPPNKLLSEASNATLDTRGTGSTGGINQNMEAVGARHRPEKRSR